MKGGYFKCGMWEHNFSHVEYFYLNIKYFNPIDVIIDTFSHTGWILSLGSSKMDEKGRISFTMNIQQWILKLWEENIRSLHSA